MINCKEDGVNYNKIYEKYKPEELDTAIRNTEKELDELEKRVDKQLEKTDEIIKEVGININIPKYKSELKITETFSMMTKKHFNRFQKFMFKKCFGIEIRNIDNKEKNK